MVNGIQLFGGSINLVPKRMHHSSTVCTTTTAGAHRSMRVVCDHDTAPP